MRTVLEFAVRFYKAKCHRTPCARIYLKSVHLDSQGSFTVSVHKYMSARETTDQKSMSLVQVPMAHLKSSIENYLAQKNLYFQRLAIDHKKTEVIDDSKIQ